MCLDDCLRIQPQEFFRKFMYENVNHYEYNQHITSFEDVRGLLNYAILQNCPKLPQTSQEMRQMFKDLKTKTGEQFFLNITRKGSAVFISTTGTIHIL